jgi:hypothetical protein
MYKTEAHVHTAEVSRCGQVCAEEIIKIYAEAGVHTVFITDHINIPSLKRLGEGLTWSERMDAFERGYLIAREAGPELVGSIGNRSAVVNNDQIVESVSRGVYQAVVSAMGQSGGNQVVEAKVNDKVLFEVVVNRNRQETMRTGYSPLLGGV